jgi:T-complex protein 11
MQVRQGVEKTLLEKGYQGNIGNVLDVVSMHFQPVDPVVQVFSMRISSYAGALMEKGRYEGSIPRVMQPFMPKIDSLVEALDKVRKLNWEIHHPTYAEISVELGEIPEVKSDPEVKPEVVSGAAGGAAAGGRGGAAAVKLEPVPETHSGVKREAEAAVDPESKRANPPPQRKKPQ